MQRKKKTSNNTLAVVVVFLLFVLFLILSSIAVKGGLLLSRSKFDGDHRFTVFSEKKNGKEGELLSFAPDTNSISVLKITSNQKLPNIRTFLETPVDGVVISDDLNETQPVEKIKHAIFLYKDIQTNMTIIDLLRLWHFSADVPDYSITTKELGIDSSNPPDELSSDKLTAALFADNTIVSEKKTIHILNATGIAGFGGRLARLITNMGGIVIAVTTADDTGGSCVVSYSGMEPYTVQRLSQVLSFDTKQLDKTELSDIVITLGNACADTHVF